MDRRPIGRAPKAFKFCLSDSRTYEFAVNELEHGAPLPPQNENLGLHLLEDSGSIIVSTGRIFIVGRIGMELWMRMGRYKSETGRDG